MYQLAGLAGARARPCWLWPTGDPQVGRGERPAGSSWPGVWCDSYRDGAEVVPRLRRDGAEMSCGCTCTWSVNVELCATIRGAVRRGAQGYVGARAAQSAVSGYAQGDAKRCVVPRCTPVRQYAGDATRTASESQVEMADPDAKRAIASRARASFRADREAGHVAERCFVCARVIMGACVYCTRAVSTAVDRVCVSTAVSLSCSV